jgi:uncharacterized membrane-anchored protein
LWIVIFQTTGYSPASLGIAVFFAPIVLAVLGTFYLWIYLKRPPDPFAV